jgi:hypothetical protein
MAQQKLAEAMPGTGAVLEQIGAGPAQVPHRLLGHGRDADGHQLAGAKQAGQPAAVTAVGLTRSPGAIGISVGAITWQPTWSRASSRASS